MQAIEEIRVVPGTVGESLHPGLVEGLRRWAPHLVWCSPSHGTASAVRSGMLAAEQARESNSTTRSCWKSDRFFGRG